MSRYFSWVQRFTENRLTRRLERIAVNKAKKSAQKTFKGELLSWLDAIAFAVVFVLLINQYLFQLFMIPSPSMVETLLIHDRVFVTKNSYGIELYPGGPKIFERTNALRDEVIVFYNPEYKSRGPLFDILSQVIYMGTFSLINIDKDEEGNMRERLYVKRAAAMGGETVRFNDGVASIRGAGQNDFTADAIFREANDLSQAPHQSIDEGVYAGINAYGSILAYQEKAVEQYLPNHLLQSYQKVANYQGAVDYYQVEKAKSKTLHALNPMDLEARSQMARYQQGIYVPHGYVLPLGDNRDNSQDGRYFGPVPYKSIIGRVLFRFWPLNRMGVVS
ncbi:MAG: signal peptidase I [Sphaerochaetaceae bacterium]